MSLSPSRPEAGEYAPFYASYVQRVPEGNLLEHLERQGRKTAALVRALPPEAAHHRYAPEKWSVVEVLGHMADAERVFAYRALRIARGDATPLAGFDEKAYVPAAGFDRRALAEVLEEFEAARRSTLALLRGFDVVAWERRGLANANPVSVRALAHIVAGHELHHLEILRTRYGVGGGQG